MYWPPPLSSVHGPFIVSLTCAFDLALFKEEWYKVFYVGYVFLDPRHWGGYL